jgi:exopolysaccharide biosynthesis polyprenyl glycosylphosphotransferase
MELSGLDRRYRDGKRLLGFLSMIKENDIMQDHFIQRKDVKSSSDQSLDQEKISDDKATRMVEVLSKQNFSKARHINQLRLTLVVWIIRGKISQNAKRAFDIIVGGLATLITSPFMLLTAIAIRLDSPGPVLFKQERVGKWGETFACYKFRSMYADAEERKYELMEKNEADEIVFKMKRDPRVTRVGRIIRKLSIDELPQLFNVLKGDMSLVGPRPPVPVEVENYEFDYFRRLDAVPGITGLQQVSGRSDLEFKRWIELDVQYIQEQSLLKDIEILLRTIPAVITGKGAY